MPLFKDLLPNKLQINTQKEKKIENKQHVVCFKAENYSFRGVPGRSHKQAELVLTQNAYKFLAFSATPL